MEETPNEVLQTLHLHLIDILFQFFQICYLTQKIPTKWKQSKSILIHKNGDPTTLPNYRLISLANALYKLFTSTFTHILSQYGETHHILSTTREGFRAGCSTTKTLQTLIAVLEDAKHTNQDIYLLYIDFKNTFGSIDHTRLLAIMEDLGYPLQAIQLRADIYTNSTTFIGEIFGETKPIKIQRGTC